MRRIACFCPSGLYCAVFAALFAAHFTSQSAAADWLVTRDGGRVETKGEWRVEGRRVLFTLPNGTLSAMRVSEVDLDASRAATEEAKQPPKPDEVAVEEPKPEPVLVLTNKDIPRAVDNSAAEYGDDRGATSSGPALRVIEWNEEPGDGGVRVIGRLENGTDQSHSGIGLRVEVRNDDGEVLATSSATVTRETLIAGGITAFEARFPGYSELPGQPTFVVTSREMRSAPDDEDSTGSTMDEPVNDAL